MTRRISERVKFQGRKFTIKDVTVRHDNGKEFTYEVNESEKRSIGAMILAIDSKKRAVLVREYFAGTDRYELSLPKGRTDEGETAVQSASRELSEETGYKAGKVILLSVMTSTPGYSNHQTHVYLATNLTRGKPTGGDEVEALEVVLMPLEKAVALAFEGKITEARAIAGLLMAKQLIDSGKVEI